MATFRRMFPVKSSNLAAMGYDPYAQVMRVEFVSGPVYEYSNVLAEVFALLMNAESVGELFAMTVRGDRESYPCRRVI
jgi:hypothetical protein